MRKVNPVRHQEKRAEIMAAADRCFAEHGFHGATIARICAAAKISPGHLYHYFPSKDAIVVAITQTGLDYAKSRFAEIAESSDPVETIAAEFERLQVQQSETGFTTLLDILAEANRNSMIGPVLREQSKAMTDLLAAFLREGQERGQIDPDLDVETAAAILISMIDGCKALGVRHPDLDRDKSSSVFRSLITKLLNPPGG